MPAPCGLVPRHGSSSVQVEAMSQAAASGIAILWHLGAAFRLIWGSAMCMGFILFRAKNIAKMRRFLDVMTGLVLKTGDDQMSINHAAGTLGIVWDEDSDMRYEHSTGYGKGVITGLAAAQVHCLNNRDANVHDHGGGACGGEGQESAFTITLLPHKTYTRTCSETPISEETTVAHCYYPGSGAGPKVSWMERANLWSIDEGDVFALEAPWPIERIMKDNETA